MIVDSLKELELVRALPVLELRADDALEGTLGVMRGHFSVVNTWYEVNSVFEGQFLERIAPGAFEKTIKENVANMRVLYDHGMDPQIGNKVLGNIDVLEEDKTGAYYEVGLFDTSYNRDLLPGLRAGAYGSSFRFHVIKDEWNADPGRSDHNPQGLPERTIHETRTMEFGPVTFPANPAATAGMRSLTDDYYQRLRSRDPRGIDLLLARAMELRTPVSDPIATVETGAALQEPTEPAHDHSGGMSPAQRRERLYPNLLRRE
jgi:HK97 family phage prohead protease